MRALALTVLAAAAAVTSVPIRGAQLPNAQRGARSDRCGPADNAYLELESATGGQVYIGHPAEMAASALAATAMVGRRPLLLGVDQLTAGTAGALSFPVDGSIRRLVITAMFEGTGGTLDLRQPDDAAVEASDRVQDERSTCSRILIVERPPAGMWRGSVAPTGRYWIRVFAESDLELADIAFVENAGQAGQPPKRVLNPMVGRAISVQADVRGPAMSSYEFALVSEDGAPLQNVAVTRTAAGSWEGSFITPSLPFRVTVRGTDAAGVPYQRSSEQLFRADVVAIEPLAPEASLTPQAETTVAFVIRNAGPPARYRLDAMAASGLSAHIEPAVIELAQDAEQQIKVWVSASASTAAGSRNELIVTASKEGPQPVSSSGRMIIQIR
jgi:hypothetical protein